ncbi:MAG TPA: peptidylprolyl isomerase [Candidatus Polarisedimenticolia bacterium]|nr:peptidylprolyl isomerase [Candidatus Polarisedimenticolia bacterium]
MKRVVLAAAAVAAVFPIRSVEASWKEKPGMYAIFETSHGRIVAELFPKEAPKTVENFVGLAEATKPYKDPNLGEMVKRRFYDGLTFHRIIPNFMMQGGDPTGTGRGGPGFNIEDEFLPTLKFDQPGRLGMANTGRPNTGSSQFFITHVPTPHLNNKHTIFGQVVEGMDVVEKICGTLGTPSGAPKEPVSIRTLKIERVAGTAGTGAAKPQTQPRP